ncbi:hypothetical protein C1645_825689 [Glomus cerebriforme]|uniref:HMG box domain-containing protein n=1 Tax=Glomus cerebriforme TaxID=658196 RepID=A0A397SS78_9GLOM|nr:hypothetical protein C1645_825689 [Glomus cerebriforme]
MIGDNFIYETPDKPKRNGPNGFITYRATSWKNYKRTDPHTTTKEFSTIAAKKWNGLPNNERNYYIKLSEEKKMKAETVREKAKRSKRSNKKKKNDKESNNTQPHESSLREPSSTCFDQEYIDYSEFYQYNITPPSSPFLYYDISQFYYIIPAEFFF